MASDQIEYCGGCENMAKCRVMMENGTFTGCASPGPGENAGSGLTGKTNPV